MVESPSGGDVGGVVERAGGRRPPAHVRPGPPRMQRAAPALHALRPRHGALLEQLGQAQGDTRNLRADLARLQGVETACAPCPPAVPAWSTTLGERERSRRVRTRLGRPQRPPRRPEPHQEGALTGRGGAEGHPKAITAPLWVAVMVWPPRPSGRRGPPRTSRRASPRSGHWRAPAPS